MSNVTPAPDLLVTAVREAIASENTVLRAEIAALHVELATVQHQLAALAAAWERPEATTTAQAARYGLWAAGAGEQQALRPAVRPPWWRRWWPGAPWP